MTLVWNRLILLACAVLEMLRNWRYAQRSVMMPGLSGIDFLEWPGKKKSGEGTMRRLMVVATAVVVFAGAGAFAGEVKGPPGTPNNTNETGALDHASSACAASGLNDLDSTMGQTVSQVQTAADSWKYYGLPKGAPGTLGLCRGGTGER
jgi:hypothetical protein